MKRFCLAGLVLGCAMQVWAQGEATVADDGSAYQRLEADRASEAAAFHAQEAACYQRFAVNDCLEKLQSSHRAALADFKRQENLLHARERALRGAEQRQRSEQKAVERELAHEHSASEPGQSQEKLQAQQHKQAAHAAKLGASGAAPSMSVESPGPGAAEQAAHRQSFLNKQAAAEKKRLEVAKRLKEKQQGKPVPPLPVPR